jgi:hypothetical protein
MVNIKLGIVGENVVATATENSGDSPTAFTIAQLRDVVMTLISNEDSDKENDHKLLIIDGVLAALENEYLNCNQEPTE